MSTNKADKDEELAPKEKGNNCVKEGNYVEAAIHYSHALKQSPKDPKLYSNRSLVFLKMEQYYFALEDAKQAIKLDPTWPKGYFRKGEAEYKAQQYAEAVKSHKQGLLHAPDDPGLQEALKKASAALKKEQREEFQQPLFGIATGALLGLLVVFMDQQITKSPVMQNTVLRVMLVVTFGAIGYAAAKAFSHINKMTRDSLMQSPDELFKGLESSSLHNIVNDLDPDERSPIGSETTRRKSGATPGKQRMRQAKRN